MTATDFQSPAFDRRTAVLQVGPLLAAMAMAGAFRSMGHIPIYFGYIAALAGLLWLGMTLRMSRFLLPSYALVFWGYASLFFNGLGPMSYAQLALVLGGVGVAEIVSRLGPARMAHYVDRYMVWIIIVFTLIELVMIQMGLGQRVRALDGELTGGLLPDLGIAVPRFMGTMGGSGYSGCMTGALAFLCLVEKKKRAATILFVITVLMVSRGPLLALLIAAAFHIFRRYTFPRVCAMILVLFAALFPLVVYYIRQTFTHEEILFLIIVSTQRFLHYMNFLEFGLENPIFGVGYGNYYEAYVDYWFTDDVQQWGTRFRTTNLIREAHNFMLDILGEIGFVGWLLAALQTVLAAWIGIWRNARYGAMLLYVVICFLFLSGLSNWTWWTSLGIVMAHARFVSDGRAADERARRPAPSQA